MVVFLGKRGQDTLPYYYSAAEVLVTPSHYESFGMVALEAMACGTPVIASQVGGLAFLVKDGVTGYTIPDGDADILCDRLSNVLGDAQLRRTLGLNAASEARDYAWEKIAPQIVAMYEQLIKQKSSP
jgi:D-inositol-3-phosphate glycosyltransferase